MSTPETTESEFGHVHHPTQLAAWMTVAEARAALVAAGQPALPVAGHTGLIGLITIEALGGEEGTTPEADAPVASVMDWHLVPVPPDADEQQVVRHYTDAAWRWLGHRRQELAAPRGRTS